MKKIITSSLILCTCCFVLIAFLSGKAFSQTVIYNENFDAKKDTTLPTGWISNPAGWSVDTVTLKMNNSTGYAGVSGLNNAVIQNSSPTGVYELITKSISTVNYKNINVIWGARLTTNFPTSGSSITSFFWSTDGSLWHIIPYTENTNNSIWELDNAGTAITLPSGTENQASLQFKWIANIVNNTKGTYRIDDFNVSGTAVTTGVEPVTANSNQAPANIYVINNSTISVTSNILHEKLNVEVFDLLGRLMKNVSMNSTSILLDASDLNKGVYFVKVSSSSASIVNKVVLK